MTILILGSINMDLVARVARLPNAGETLTGTLFETVPGGKGANQAAGCARLGAAVRMIGRVGTDSVGAVLRTALQTAGVDDALVDEAPGSSGVALITVASSGENTIVVVPGANGAVGADDLARLHTALGTARALLLQLEVPLNVVAAAAVAAHAAGVPVILDPAPAQELPNEFLRHIDLLTPNEHEAAILTGLPTSTLDDVQTAAHALLARGPRAVVIKRGAAGCFYTDGSTEYALPAPAVTAVDTVAAGDAFNAGLAVALAEGADTPTALRWALATGALAVTRPGAQDAMPTRAEVLALLAAATLSQPT